MAPPLALLDRVSWSLLLPIAAALAAAPVLPEPHLWQKLRMLAEGTLVRPIDIFDLVFHGSGLVLVALKLARARRTRAR